MSTLVQAESSVPTRTSVSPRHILSGLTLAVAGVAIVAGHALTVDPNLPAGDYVRTFAHHHTSGTIGGLLTAVGAFLLLPGIAGLLGLIGRSRLATAGAFLWAVGACALGAGDVMITLVMSALVRDHPQMARSLVGVADHSGVLGLPFLLAPALIIGGIIIGVALWRSGAVAPWLAALLCVGQVLIGFSSGGGVVSAAVPLLPMGVALVLLGRAVSVRPTAG